MLGKFHIGDIVQVDYTNEIYTIDEIDSDGWCIGKTPGDGWHPDRLTKLSITRTMPTYCVEPDKPTTLEFKSIPKFKL